MAITRSSTIGPAAKPVAIPEQFLTRSLGATQTDTVILPLHIWWSEPQRSFNFNDRTQLIRAYGLILAEGTKADVLHFIDPEILLSIWSELLIPRHVQEAWEAAFARWGVRP
jgi:hypothetical protein